MPPRPLASRAALAVGQGVVIAGAHGLWLREGQRVTKKTYIKYTVSFDASPLLLGGAAPGAADDAGDDAANDADDDAAADDEGDDNDGNDNISRFDLKSPSDRG